MTSPADVFAALWDAAARHIDRVNFPGYACEDTTGTIRYDYEEFVGEGGRYATHDNGVRVIFLFRKDGERPANEMVPDLVTQPIRDACILAHEYGHFLSELAGNKLVLIERDGPLPSADVRRDVIDEEERAWALGRETLVKLGCDQWADFDRQARQSLDGYRRGFFRWAAHEWFGGRRGM